MLAGWRPGSELKCWTPGGVPPGSLILGASPASFLGAVSAILNSTSPSPPAPTRSGSAETVTVSPGLKGFAGRKLAPFPSECDSSRPECLPVSEPVTLIPVRSFFDAPRKLIWVAAVAASLPSEGKTATGTLVPAEVLTSATMKSAAITTAPATKSLTRFDKAQIVASGVRPPDRRFRRRPLFILAARRQMRAIGALAGTVIVLGALVAPGWAVDPVHDSLIYCNGSLDGGASGAFTDREHTVIVGDPPLPPGVRRERITIDGVSTPVMQCGPRRAR